MAAKPATTDRLTSDPIAPPLDSEIAPISALPVVPSILEVVCRATGMGFAAVARVTADRWVACGVHDDIAFGLVPGGELRIDTTICREIRDTHQPVVIDDVALHPRYCNHPTPALYGFRSYISMPILLADGSFFGTLCAIDPRPAQVDRPEIIGMFKLFAELIAFHVDALTRLDQSHASLLAERETATLREQFIAVLAHDLRNPLAAISAGTRILARAPLNQRAADVLLQMQRSVTRISGLIDNVLDFARGRLGGGFTLRLDPDCALADTLHQILSELKSAWPERRIETSFNLAEPVTCDLVRIGQLFSNLLGNALVHGDQDQPVRVAASTHAGILELSVANAGDPIPPAAMDRLFQPFFRGEVRPSQQGLGLGLFIAAEIARAHAGTLTVSSTPEETRLTLRIPTQKPP